MGRYPVPWGSLGGAAPRVSDHYTHLSPVQAVKIGEVRHHRPISDVLASTLSRASSCAGPGRGRALDDFKQKERRNNRRRPGHHRRTVPNQTDAERAIQDLQAAGVDQSRIGVAIRDHGRQRDLGEVTTTDGNATGGILGGVAGMLAGPGALAVPGVGPLIVAGVLAPALARISAAGGGLVTTLVAMGSTERNANYFEKGLREGSVLVTASAGSLGSEVGRSFGRPAGTWGHQSAKWPGISTCSGARTSRRIPATPPMSPGSRGAAASAGIATTWAMPDPSGASVAVDR